MTEHPGPGISASFWHTGVVVPDLDRAMDELHRTTGADWLPPQERPDGDRVLRVSFNTRAPFVELIQGNPGGVWSTDDGPRLDHLAYWTDAFASDVSTFAELGGVREAGGTSIWGGNWAYMRLPASGIRIELCDIAGRDAFLDRWQLAGAF